MILSVLIPSIPERDAQLQNLLEILRFQIALVKNQHPSLGDVEILTNVSAKFIDGGASVGMKRNSLVKQARGKYLCFLDDDDMISPRYIEMILRMAERDMDIICFRQLFKCDTYWSVVDFNLSNENEEATPENTFKRKPFHICPIKTHIARKYEFADMNNAEDWDWMSRVLNDVRSQETTLEILHQYNHFNLKSAVDEIERINSLT